jgi:OPA family glycerol-3-phosphate transporter-like MFS transporter
MASDKPAQELVHPPGFRRRRGQNWAFLGLLYTSFYMCRYNLPLANEAISKELGFSKADMGAIITTALLAYAFGQIINGLLTDRLGGKRAMLIGAAGTIVMNLAFGAASFAGLLGLFIAIRGVDGYLQAFGAPGMVKVNAAWFYAKERGRFGGIFGFMINAGRFGIFSLGPALLSGFTFLGILRIPPLHWRWLFWAPTLVAAFFAVCVLLFTKDTPAEAGFPAVETDDARKREVEADRAGGRASREEVRAPLREVLRTVLKSPAIWLVASAYACTGAVRQGIDQWFPRFMQEVHHADLHSRELQFLGFLIPFVASAGSLVSGYVSDMLFGGRRAPVAAALYFVETVIILLAAQFHTAQAAVVFLVLISFTANATHSLLGTAAAMDIGGRRMAGFSSGLIDSFQYFGGSLAGYALGRLLDKSWDTYFYAMAPFGIIGGTFMLVWLRRHRAEPAAT